MLRGGVFFRGGVSFRASSDVLPRLLRHGPTLPSRAHGEGPDAARAMLTLFFRAIFRETFRASSAAAAWLLPFRLKNLLPTAPKHFSLKGFLKTASV